LDANGNVTTVVRQNIQYFETGVAKINGEDKRGQYGRK
jgi:DUF917 family protein